MSISILNQTKILDPRLQPVLSNYSYPWDKIQDLAKFHSRIGYYAVRSGKNTLPFDNSIVRHLDLQMPDYNNKFDLNLHDITDQRAIELAHTYTDKLWLVLWSGGIDSTALLVSILKNIPKTEHHRIKVALNKISIYENPRFYYNYILPNFNTVNSTLRNDQIYQGYYVINGEFSDQLFSGSVALELQQLDISSLELDVFQYPEKLIDYLSLKFESRSTAEWFYQIMIDNITSVDIPIQTYYDFFWWFFFNLMWPSIKIRTPINYDYTPSFMELFLKNSVSWFESKEYQQWAMCNTNSKVKYGLHIGQYKQQLKEYIYNFDHDEYYFTFKTKGNSNSILRASHNWFCLLDDYRLLTLDNDLEEILELLPAHIVV